MPDHLHLFLSCSHEKRIDQWTRMLKQHLGKTLLNLGWKSPFWQRGFFDHLIRNDESYEQKWEYVQNNPVRAGLVKNDQEWLYQGEIIKIRR